MTDAVIYTRFSPRRNAEESESCTMQENTCRRYAEAKGYNVIEAFNDEDVSGKDAFREKLWEAIEMLKRGSVLIVYKRDRLARDLYLSEQINRSVSAQGARIEAVSGDVAGSGPEQDLIRQVLASISEYERKLIAMRTSWAMKQHQKNGKRMGRYAPYGWKIDPNDETRIVEEPTEQKVVKIVKALHEKGISIYKITNALNEKMPEKARHEKWNAKLIGKIIERM